MWQAVLINKLGAASKAATSAEAAEQACKYAAQHKQEQLEVQLRSLRLQLQFYGAEWASQQDKVKKSESEILSASHEVNSAALCKCPVTSTLWVLWKITLFIGTPLFVNKTFIVSRNPERRQENLACLEIF